MRFDYSRSMCRSSCLALALIAAPSIAVAEPAAPQLNLALDRRCENVPPSSDEVVVCGERGRSPYRIDSDELEAVRQQERAANPPRPPAHIAEGKTCAVGPQACPGEGAVDFIRPALVIASAALKAAQGEDWREPFRTGPDAYQQYRDSKAKRDRKRPSVSISLGN